ncbi:hypothetical protein MYCTH_2311427 [Thermothelomyces thermophilus ATCC 42464]|uniref:Septation initiation network scaffold protein cdc11 n=1 Tax=Thermothelomyces thermophilus (strain ATCC 42464 / BCRC 31852 / DSM 1799) TaxID=573729 RepID=G2QP51_THET4|nr:uncharacterized protein MYCTH_2311427 [Thermothelomyces thermophilus ATCC 42464]AEO61364.1 hypothetical protein MYCTH_2311427 [Thermothelomyces thermophilus ATCC 42464]
MGHAWLDSLSEDWVSQPGSADASFAEHEAAPVPAQKLPKPQTPSRIPRLSPHVRKFQSALGNAGNSNASNGNSATKSNSNSNNSNNNNNSSSSNILSERSLNERLAAQSRRTPSKLSQEVSPNTGGRDCPACRSASASTTNSVVRRPFLRKSTGTSQSKGRAGDTPEWKRRLVYGELSYGEQKDLFTSAGAGLESIFKPPHPTPGPSRDGKMDDSCHEHDQEQDFAAPPSPPSHRRNPLTVDTHVDESPQQLPQPQPSRRAGPPVRYRRTEESPDTSKDSELSMQQHESCSCQTSKTDQTALSAEEGPRKVSGRSDIRNEDFSPILLERRQASNGATTFSPADLPPDELRKRLEMLRRNQMLLAGGANDGTIHNHTPSRNETTEDYVRLEGFVNFQRGGRSEEGSFRNRMLSSALNDSSELNPEESLQASTPKQFLSVRVEQCDSSEHRPVDSPDVPRVPDPSPEKRLAPVQPSPGSPLKLFQPYDTFTSQTLLRRLSQVHGEAGDISFSIAVDESRMQGDNPSGLLPPASQNGPDDHSFAHASRFGAGELDGYEFNDEFSHLSHNATCMDGDKENREPAEDSLLPQRQPIFDLPHNSSPSGTPDLVVNRRRKSTNSRPSRRSARASFPAYSDMLSPPGGRRDLSGTEIKRPRTSPSKNPTPKRRRTLHRSDISYGSGDPNSGVDSAQLSHLQMQSVLGRLRQDVRESDEHEMAGHDLHHSLRSRTPTPSQRRSLQAERQPLAQIERSPARSSRHSQPPAALPLGTTVETNRKSSIKTEDFINEANKIMAMIRSKAGLPSGLASVEESDEEKGQPSPELEGSFEESTQEPFSRPPSREGRPPLTRKSTKQEDPVLAEQLKKYEEASDMGDILPSSVRSSHPVRGSDSVTREQATEEWAKEQSQRSGSQVNTVSDPPNIRISRNSDWQEQQSANGPADGIPSQGSAGLNTQSTGLSLPTGSSRVSSKGSEARKTIMPESVSHLIPDQVGNMVLDRQRNMWVKRKSTGEPKESFYQSEASDDDPFAGIPDLSVDVTKEMQNLLLTGKRETALQNRVASSAEISPTRPPRVGSFTRAALDAAGGMPTNQAPNSGSAEIPAEKGSSVNEGRVKELRRLTISFSSPVASVIQDAGVTNEMLSEDSMLNAQAEAPAPPARGRRLVSVQTTMGSRTARSRSTSRGPARHLSIRGKSLMARPVSRIDERDEDSASHHDQPQEAASGMELSVLGDYSVANHDDGGPRGSLNFLVTTPARAPSCPVSGADAAPIISQYVGTFSLSPLSEFTVHRPEETLPLEASYVVDNHRLVTGDKPKHVMSMSIRELVEKLAEVEPFEPYWEDMRELELREKGLSALHALDEYCGQLESLDVSKNKIRNLGGIPSSVLHLRITHNQLSSLTAWNHLINLQYIDVSNNSLTSLAVFKNLIHLRSLRADNNQITSLDGIKFHKGLQTLRVRGNLIKEVDFDGSTLHQLTDLDLKNNQIRHVANIDQLPLLSSLDLDGNRLTSFSVDSAEPMTSLRYLRLDDNNLTTLNVRALPHLRLLHADRNALVQIAGFSRARRIDSLSLREQRGAEPLDLPHLLSRAYEVRKLYLSGNLLQSFSPKADLLNLQLLELANCGLSSLPQDVGLMTPNLRVLNLNMNALTDLTPLRAVPRLKRLFAAGNRLADPAGVVGTLGGLACLAVVDLRDNPLTQGFYAPVQVVVRKSGSDDSVADGAEGEQQFVLGDQDAERDARYCARLDMDTRMRRRLYETMVKKKCARVKKLDGLVLGDAAATGESDGKEGVDVVWAAMEEKGLVKTRGSGSSSAKGEKNEGVPAAAADADAAAGEKEAAGTVRERSGRWPAEDSFA